MTHWRWDRPDMFGVVCFLTKIQFTKCTIDLDPLNHMLCIDLIDSRVTPVSVENQYIWSVDYF